MKFCVEIFLKNLSDFHEILWENLLKNLSYFHEILYRNSSQEFVGFSWNSVEILHNIFSDFREIL